VSANFTTWALKKNVVKVIALQILSKKGREDKD